MRYLEQDEFRSIQSRHCEEPQGVERRPSLRTGYGDEAIQGNVGRSATLDRRVGLRPPRDDDSARTHLALGWRAIALAFVAAAASPVAAEDAPAKGAAMSRGWEFGEQGGAEVFDNVCAACHQPDAKGAVGAGAYPPLADDKRLVSAEFMLDVLLRGRKGMPPLGDMMSDAQVADIVTYVRTHFGNAYPGAVSAADVAAARRQAPP
jgi:mono/diheme cytochrome c family protein